MSLSGVDNEMSMVLERLGGAGLPNRIHPDESLAGVSNSYQRLSNGMYI